MDDDTRKILERSFPPETLRQRQGPGGKTFTYAPLQMYLDRLAEAFGGDWSLEIVRRDIVEDQILVEVRVQAGGVAKSGLGGAAITRRREDGRMLDLGNDHKRAEADAIKRCARMYGIGRGLYTDDVDDPVDSFTATPQRPAAMQAGVAPRNQPSRVPAPAGGSRVTNKQLSAIWSIARARGYSEVDFRHYCVENFGAQPEFLSKHVASRIIERLNSNTNGQVDRTTEGA